MRRYLGEEHAAPYFSVVMLLVESMLPLTVIGIAFLLSFVVGHQTELVEVYTIMMVRALLGLQTTVGADQPVLGRVATDVDLASRAGKCMGERHDGTAAIDAKIL